MANTTGGKILLGVTDDGVVKGVKDTNAPRARIQDIGRGTDKVHILDRKDFDGGIVADIEDAMRFIERNTRLAYRIEGLRRQNIPEYPMEAVREAITNAVMHRDWFMADAANVFVELYADRIEVISPARCPRVWL